MATDIKKLNNCMGKRRNAKTHIYKNKVITKIYSVKVTIS